MERCNSMLRQPFALLKRETAVATAASNSLSDPNFTSICAISRTMVFPPSGQPVARAETKRRLSSAHGDSLALDTDAFQRRFAFTIRMACRYCRYQPGTWSYQCLNPRLADAWTSPRHRCRRGRMENAE